VSPLTLTLTENLLTTQVTTMLVTAADAAVPLPFATLHIWLGLPGCMVTVTEYCEPAATSLANVNEPLAFTVNTSVPLVSPNVDPDASPETEPPIE
jgi:hypothetical protein